MPGFSGVRGALELIFAPELYHLTLGTLANGQRSRSREWLIRAPALKPTRDQTRPFFDRQKRREAHSTPLRAAGRAQATFLRLFLPRRGCDGVVWARWRGWLAALWVWWLA